MNSLLVLVVISGVGFSSARASPPVAMVEIGSGEFLPFTSRTQQAPKKEISKTPVNKFALDKFLVSNADYLLFVKSHGDWRKSQIKSLFADSHYLEHWQSDFEVPKSKLNEPVVFVSWFAAAAYCESLGKDLATTDEWEFVLADNGRDREKLQTKILSWYSKPNSGALAPVSAAGRNNFGVSGLGFVVWEWTSDFNSFMLSADSRESGSKDSNFFCGNGSQMGDPSDYGAFMRYSFRSSLKANYTTANLGFRCAKPVGEIK